MIGLKLESNNLIGACHSKFLSYDYRLFLGMCNKWVYGSTPIVLSWVAYSVTKNKPNKKELKYIVEESAEQRIRNV